MTIPNTRNNKLLPTNQQRTVGSIDAYIPKQPIPVVNNIPLLHNNIINTLPQPNTIDSMLQEPCVHRHTIGNIKTVVKSSNNISAVDNISAADNISAVDNTLDCTIRLFH